MAYTYQFTKSGFNTTITVYKDGTTIYSKSSSTASKDQILSEAKIALRDNYPGSGSMTETLPPNASVTATTPTPPPPTPTPSTAPPPPPPKVTKPAGKGFEALITTISKGLATLENGMDNIYYGDKLKKSGVKIPGTTGKQNGILPIAVAVSKIDLCHIISFLLKNTQISDITGQDTAVAKQIKDLQAKARQLASDIQSGQISSRSIKNKQEARALHTKLTTLSANITDETVAASPQLAAAKNNIDDTAGSIAPYIGETATGSLATGTPATPRTGSITTTTGSQSGFNATGAFNSMVAAQGNFQDLNSIPNAEVQKILGKIRGVQSIVSSIGDMQTPQQFLDIVNNVTKVNLSNQIAQLEKLINPAQLLPAFRQIANVLKSVNQIALKVLKFIKMLQVVNKVVQVIILVMNIISKILLLIPIPNMFTATNVNQSLAAAFQKVDSFLQKIKKIVSEIAALINLVYRFISSLTSKIDQLLYLVNIIISKLERCNARNDSATLSPILAELQSGVSAVTSVKVRLETVAGAYIKAEADKSGLQKTFNGYTMRIVEEELVDEGKTYRRRKAIAVDARGVLVAETELTFATDIPLLYEELQLLLKNKGLVSDTGAVGEVGTLVDDITEDTPSTGDIYSSTGLTSEEDLKEVAAEVQEELSNFIAGLKKGGKKFKKTIRQKLSQFATQSAQDLKQSAKAGTFKGAQESKSTFAGNMVGKMKTSTGTEAKDNKADPAPVKLPLAEREKWERIARNEVFNPVTRAVTVFIYPPALRKKAIEIIAKDDKAYADGE